jgi:hypothetical protein
VSSAFLAQPDGNYNGNEISNFHLQIGAEDYNQNSAFNANLQGISLVNHNITNVTMNWTQTSQGVNSPYMQAGSDGSWEAGSSILVDSASILRGTAGSQSFAAVPEPTTALILLAPLAALPLLRRRRSA